MIGMAWKRNSPLRKGRDQGRVQGFRTFQVCRAVRTTNLRGRMRYRELWRDRVGAARREAVCAQAQSGAPLPAFCVREVEKAWVWEG